MAQAIRPPHLRGSRPTHPVAPRDRSVSALRFRGRHHAAAIFVVVILAVAGIRFYPGKTVTVFRNGESVHVAATFDGRKEALNAAGVEVAAGDRVLYSSSGRYTNVSVQHGRDVVATVDEKNLMFRTQASTVGGALVEAGIELQTGDRVYLGGQPTTTTAALVPQTTFVSRAASDAALPPLDGEALRISVVRARPVVVYFDTLRVETKSSAATVQQLLGDLGMTIREGDLVKPALSTPLSAGTTVRLAKARVVTVTLDGKEQTLYTLAGTVGDILKLLGVDPGPDELLSLPRETIVRDGMSLQIGLNRTIEETVEEAIVPGTSTVYNSQKPQGDVEVIAGENGLRVRKYSVSFKNGVEVSRTLISSEVVKIAKPTLNIIGTQASASSKPSISTPTYNGTYTRTMTVRTTWYNAASSGRPAGDPHYGLTASGMMLEKGICAVDPTVIPWLSRFYVPGYGVCLAADTGGAIKGNIVDLGYPDSWGDPGWPNSTVEIYFLD